MKTWRLFMHVGYTAGRFIMNSQRCSVRFVSSKSQNLTNFGVSMGPSGSQNMGIDRHIGHNDVSFSEQENTPTKQSDDSTSELFEKIPFPGAKDSVYTTKLELHNRRDILSTFRVLNRDGQLIDKSIEVDLGKEKSIRIYESMVQLSIMDTILYEAQRQGRISFYMTSYGEEATHIGSCEALDAADEIFGQYRETGVLMWRGFTLDEVMQQCYSTHKDTGKGRQMPVHYGSKLHHFQTISSPLGTQLPQAAGAAYVLKQQKSNDGNVKNIAVCYFGEGAASEGDFHAALNFAATLKCPVLFFCRNNGYAISTPSQEQYQGDGIAGRGPGYGMTSIRVDGNDLLAVYLATKKAREHIIKTCEPVLIEAMTYRLGHHSTSDDSFAYRSKDEVHTYMKKDHPIEIFKKYLLWKSWYSEENDVAFRKDTKAKVLTAFHAAELEKKPPLRYLFTDVYDKLPPNLERQQSQLLEHLNEFGEHYPNDLYLGGLQGLKDK